MMVVVIVMMVVVVVIVMVVIVMVVVIVIVIVMVVTPKILIKTIKNHQRTTQKHPSILQNHPSSTSARAPMPHTSRWDNNATTPNPPKKHSQNLQKRFKILLTITQKHQKTPQKKLQTSPKALKSTHQLCTISFCTARSASYLTLGSSWDNNAITYVFPPSCSMMLEEGEGGGKMGDFWDY